eukprot:4872466-Pyramimonas_sp.AAC.1
MNIRSHAMSRNDRQTASQDCRKVLSQLNVVVQIGVARQERAMIASSVCRFTCCKSGPPSPVPTFWYWLWYPLLVP